MKVIHYREKNNFTLRKIKDVQNSDSFGIKPKTGGLWTSSLGAEYGWNQWCQDENFRDNKYEYLLELNNPKLLIIDTLDDLINALDKYPNQKYYSYMKRLGVFNKFSTGITKTALDFEAIAQDYDGIHLTSEGQWRTRMTNPCLYGWDCETVLILNKKSIKSWQRLK